MYAGKEACKVYKTFHWAEEDDAMKFGKVIKAFKQYCTLCRNILYEYHKFWSLKQKEG